MGRSRSFPAVSDVSWQKNPCMFCCMNCRPNSTATDTEAACLHVSHFFTWAVLWQSWYIMKSADSYRVSLGNFQKGEVFLNPSAGQSCFPVHSAGGLLPSYLCKLGGIMFNFYQTLSAYVMLIWTDTSDLICSGTEVTCMSPSLAPLLTRTLWAVVSNWRWQHFYLQLPAKRRDVFMAL